MAFTTEANKIFMIMGYFGNQKMTNFYDMVSIKPSPIFGLRFSTNLAVTLSSFSGNITSLLPFSITVRDFATSPIRVILALWRLMAMLQAEFSTAVNQCTANRARLFRFSFCPSPGLAFFLYCLWRLPLLVCQNLNMALYTHIGARRNQNPAMGTVLINSLPVLQCVSHIYIITAFEHNNKPAHQRRVT